MFATLNAALPRPDLPPDAPVTDLIAAIVADQEAAGIGILSDGRVLRPDPVAWAIERLDGLDAIETAGHASGAAVSSGPAPRFRARHEPRWDGPMFLADWEVVADATELPVSQSIPGPYSLGRLAAPGSISRERLTMTFADALAHELRTLVEAGVPMIVVDEPEAARIGNSRSEQQLFKAAHRRLTNAIRDAHLTLAAGGGHLAGIEPRTFFDAPYRSYLIDVVSVPENWKLVVWGHEERGLIVGAPDVATDRPDDAARLAWAALYAAAIRGRGQERVGIAPIGSLATRSVEDARAVLALVAAVATETQQRIAGDPAILDPERLAREGLAAGYFGNVEGGAVEGARERSDVAEA